jgi:AcrR family transcriptional regulator
LIQKHDYALWKGRIQLVTPRPDVSQARREQIITAAVSVFTRLGFHEARMDDIVQESGLSKGALYWYFKSKDDIIAAIMDRFIDREIEGMESALKLEAPVAEKLLRLHEMFIEEMRDMIGLMPILYEFYAAATRKASVRKALLRFFQPMRKLLSALLQQGIDNGEFKPVDADVIAVDLIAFYEGLLLLAVLDPKGVDLKKMGDSGARLLVDGLRRKP